LQKFSVPVENVIKRYPLVLSFFESKLDILELASTGTPR